MEDPDGEIGGDQRDVDDREPPWVESVGQGSIVICLLADQRLHPYEAAVSETPWTRARECDAQLQLSRQGRTGISATETPRLQAVWKHPDSAAMSPCSASIQGPHPDPVCSLHFRGTRRNTATRLTRLITRRSQVQILPLQVQILPPLLKGPETGLSPTKPIPTFAPVCCMSLTGCSKRSGQTVGS
jgi:hypothetical protein